MEIIFWIGIGILVIILVAGVLFGLPETKGWAGERVVRMVLKSLPEDKYIILNDVKLYGSEIQKSGKKRNWSCQKDHLVISVYGIFCMESKNYLGKISGNYKDKYLTRRVLGMRYKTYSPIYQNYRHLQRLVKTFPLIKSHYKDLHSIICFMLGGNPKIHGGGPATVCMVQSLKKNLLRYQTPLISEQECEEIAKTVIKVSCNH